MIKVIGLAILALVLFGAAFAGAYYFQDRQNEKMAVQVQQVAVNMLRGLHEQDKLTAFSGRFESIVNITPPAVEGEEAQAAYLVVPGTVNYELNLRAIQQKHIVWDAEKKTLEIELPPLTISPPALDGAALASGAPMSEDTIRRRAIDQISRRAHAPEVMDMAKGAARAAVERAFLMSLRAAGNAARLNAHFPEQAEGVE